MFKSKREGASIFLGYNCEMSQSVISRIVDGWKKLYWHKRSELTIEQISQKINPDYALECEWVLKDLGMIP